MSAAFFTGFPGFLGSALLPKVLDRSPDSRAVCLVQSKFADLARLRADQLIDEHPSLEGRIELVEGDITEADLALETSQELLDEVREIYHLAAVYDLSVPRGLAMRVNVEGTRHVLDFAERCPGLERLHYVSTCYVSGRWAGIFTENDLDKGQEFNNYYEETKFRAEVEVQQRMKGGLPATIYRPGIVVGDSRTGETQKFDGPYFLIRWVLRQGPVAVIPVVGDPTAIRVNLVPSDFTLDAVAHLSGMAGSLGKVYQLTDPNALTVDEIIDEIGRATGKQIFRVPLPKSLAKLAIERVPGVYWLMKIPSTAIDYFVHPTFYTSENTRIDLAGTGIECPALPSYLRTLVKYLENHPEIGSEAMV